MPAGACPLTGEDDTGIQATPTCSCFPPAWAGPLCTPYPHPAASPQPGSDMAFVFLPGCSLSGDKGLRVWEH